MRADEEPTPASAGGAVLRNGERSAIADRSDAPHGDLEPQDTFAAGSRRPDARARAAAASSGRARGPGMLTNTAEYAIRAVLHLAAAAGSAPVRVDEIAAAIDVPRNYLSKVMHVLAKDGVLASTRGAAGGFSLARPADELTLAEIIGRFDPIEDRCLLMRRPCSEQNPCMAHRYWRQVAVEVRTFFRNTTVSDLLDGAARPDGPPRTVDRPTTGNVR